MIIPFPCAGRKTGKGCYVYGDGKKKTVNEEAVKLMDKYRIPLKGRQVLSSVFSRDRSE